MSHLEAFCLNENSLMGDGHIHKSVQYSVWCKFCDNLLDYSEYRNKQEAIKAFREAGWQNTKLGWRCFDCRTEIT